MDEQHCMYCGGHLEAKPVTRAQQYQGRWIVIENLPAMVCRQCGEIFYTPEAHDLVVALVSEQVPPVRVEQVNVYDAASIARKAG